VLILRGEHAPPPTRVIAEGLPELLPNSQLIVVSGAGHMGPLTSAREVSRLITQHIDAAGLVKSQCLQALSRSRYWTLS
jgi:pimeloyl-ACP methyl ester carboxylesterase